MWPHLECLGVGDIEARGPLHARVRRGQVLHEVATRIVWSSVIQPCCGRCVTSDSARLRIDVARRLTGLQSARRGACSRWLCVALDSNKSSQHLTAHPPRFLVAARLYVRSHTTRRTRGELVQCSREPERPGSRASPADRSSSRPCMHVA